MSVPTRLRLVIFGIFLSIIFVLNECNEGFVSKKSLMNSLKWEEERATRALYYMVREGLAWVDDQATGGRQYWFPSFFP